MQIRLPESFLLPFIIFIALSLQIKLGFNLWDEGFLWYGVQQILDSGLPIRDFYAYDPGRYFWSAFFFATFDNEGILLLRISAILFLIIGLAGTLFLLKPLTQKKNWFECAMFGLCFLLWAFPRWKFFDISLSLITFCLIAAFLSKPVTKRLAICVFFVGMFIFWGRNHALYLAVAISISTLIAIRWGDLSFKSILTKLHLLVIAFVAGLSPLIYLLLFSEGFADAYWESIRFILVDAKTTTIPREVPWPWTIKNVDYLSIRYIGKVWLGICFILILSYGLLGTCYSILFAKPENQERQKYNSPILLSSFICSLLYSHHAFSSADISHLAQSIFPMLIGIFWLIINLEKKIAYALSVLAFCVSLAVMLPVQPFGQFILNKNWQTQMVIDDKIKMSKRNALDINLLNELVAKYAPASEDIFLVSPVWPGAYALHKRRAPNWEIYSLYNRGKNFELAEITKIEQSNIKFSVILDFPIARQEHLRYSNSHPYMNEYITNRYTRLEHSKLDTKSLPDYYQIYLK